MTSIRVNLGGQSRWAGQANQTKVNPARFHCSGSAEIAIDGSEGLTAYRNNTVPLALPTVSAELCLALAACHRDSPTQLLVRGWKEKVHSFAPPYRLYDEMLAGGSDAVDHVLADDFFQKNRERAPSRDKVALIAITVFVKPAKEDQSACSDYACVLEHAHDCRVPPGKLADWLLTTTLSRCKRVVRAKRKAEKIGIAGRSETAEASQVMADLPPDSLDLDVSSEETEHGTDRLVKFTCPLGRVELIAPADNVGPLPELLRQLADYLEKTVSQKEANDA
ncbi:hypothetical protein NKI80_25240 [Mesorhizobium sp. M0387]|uniref:hypothetical protein n=1 Tax=Mesorhizobium sp. M0387 TaxID=2956940 RepID=UPI003338CE90